MVRTILASVFVPLMVQHSVNKDGDRIEKSVWGLPITDDNGVKHTSRLAITSQGEHITADNLEAFLARNTTPLSVSMPRKLSPTVTVNGIPLTQILSGRYQTAQRVRELLGITPSVVASEPVKPAKNVKVSA